MIITALLKLVLFVLGVLSNLFVALIPSLPDSIMTLLDTVIEVIFSGISFITYFTHWDILIICIGILLSWYAFINIKNIVMKIIGHFIAN